MNDFIKFRTQQSLNLRQRLDHRRRDSANGFYSSSFQFLQEGVALIELCGTVREANPSMYRLLGLNEPEGLIGQDIHQFLAEEHKEQFESWAEFVCVSGSPIGPIEIHFSVSEPNHLICQMLLAPMVIQGKNFLHLALRDVTEWRSIQNTLINTHMELEQSYSITLEGWGRAMELRDFETQGHMKRVTDATVNLALSMGVSMEEIPHIRHGAVLHDIGKFAIPDAILLKPGPLTPDEWVVMKRHPVYAYDLLKPVNYLARSLAIPYSHHEKWDGSGYPQALSTTQIPLSARIFAVIDVWDALRSDRPYRASWSDEHIREYIKENSGSHFDPDVAACFLDNF